MLFCSFYDYYYCFMEWLFSLRHLCIQFTKLSPQFFCYSWYPKQQRDKMASNRIRWNQKQKKKQKQKQKHISKHIICISNSLKCMKENKPRLVGNVYVFACNTIALCNQRNSIEAQSQFNFRLLRRFNLKAIGIVFVDDGPMSMLLVFVAIDACSLHKYFTFGKWQCKFI